MKLKNRTDRILILSALAVLVIAGGLYSFDVWTWFGPHKRGEFIGKVLQHKGDVRLKYHRELSWQNADEGTGIANNDTVYAAANSEADVELHDSQFSLTENTLVILKRYQGVSQVKLDYGFLMGNLLKTEKFTFLAGDKSIEFQPSEDCHIVFRRSEGKTQFDILSGRGTLKVDGKASEMDRSTSLVIAGEMPAQIKPVFLQLVKPMKDDMIASEDASRIDFEWVWGDGRPAAPSDVYMLEFSGQPSFKKLHASKRVEGQLVSSMTVKDSLSLYFRIKGPGGEVSPISQVNYLRIERPLIMMPQAGATIPYNEDGASKVAMEFQTKGNAAVWYQIATDAEFANVVAEENTRNMKPEKKLPAGQYFMRARSDYGHDHVSSWTEPKAFSVDAAPKILALDEREIPGRVVIPNRAYPANLYSAGEDEIQEFLAGRGFLANFFPMKAEEFDEIQIKMEDGEVLAQKETTWPRRLMSPGIYTFRYQAVKAERAQGEWTQPKTFEISVEPPRPAGKAASGAPDENGLLWTTWNFTPVLYAKSYDVEVSETPDFNDPIEIKSFNANARTKLMEGDYFWRVRARDHHGRIISSFSQIYDLNASPNHQVPEFLARGPASVGGRGPASQVGGNRIERMLDKPWESTGWWMWMGMGHNYVDYKQSAPGVLTFNSHQSTSGSKFLEAGYATPEGLGGVVSYKQTPGMIFIDGGQVVPNTYEWTTASLEALVKKNAPFRVANTPVKYGVRAGVQQHKIPFVMYDNQNSLALKDNQMTTASVGMTAELARDRWKYYWMMRYQFPISTKASGASTFNINPVLAFDGSLGASYDLTKQMKLGLFWYGQWHQFNFRYYNGDTNYLGYQSLFYSSIDLRLGFDF